MASTVIHHSDDAEPRLEQLGEGVSPRWRPVVSQECGFDSSSFIDVMMNLVKNPNITSSWLFRADILEASSDQQEAPAHPSFHTLICKKVLVRRLIPRNPKRDKPLNQTCLFYETSEATDGPSQSLVVYLPHVASVSELPFYHPKVRAAGFLHEWAASQKLGSLSIHYLYFDEEVDKKRLRRTALSLLTVIHKHAQGRMDGYTKRVKHDIVVPQPAFQDRYTMLKAKYAKNLIETWKESTDPVKHVFEDLGIAAFLVELWTDMFRTSKFPGFVDIGCGNGLLVYILNQEGYPGWGFDARSRKSWSIYDTDSVSLGNMEAGSRRVSLPLSPTPRLRQLVLMPDCLPGSTGLLDMAGIGPDRIQNGVFPKGTFIISNHADELTPWTPILAAQSDCPFIMIPCCSHDLAGAKYRAPAPKGEGEASSTYGSLVAWVSQIASDCGWEAEKEMLRIPSTRNAAIIGRHRTALFESFDTNSIIQKYGGASGYKHNAARLLKNAPSGH